MLSCSTVKTVDLTGRQYKGGLSYCLETDRGFASIIIVFEDFQQVKAVVYLVSTVTERRQTRRLCLIRFVQVATALSRLNIIWRSRNVTVKTKLILPCSIDISIFLYTCEPCTRNKDMAKRILAFENDCCAFPDF